MVDILSELLFAALAVALAVSVLLGTILLLAGIPKRRLGICVAGGGMAAAGVVGLLALVALAVSLNDGSIMANGPSGAAP